jgi:hypothetical protein
MLYFGRLWISASLSDTHHYFPDLLTSMLGWQSADVREIQPRACGTFWWLPLWMTWRKPSPHVTQVDQEDAFVPKMQRAFGRMQVMFWPPIQSLQGQKSGATYATIAHATFPLELSFPGTLDELHPFEGTTEIARTWSILPFVEDSSAGAL